MQTTTKTRTPALTVGARTYNRTLRTRSEIERVMRGAEKKLAKHAVLVDEHVLRSTAFRTTRRQLERHLVEQAVGATISARALLFEIVDAVRATPPHRAPVVIATVEGRVILQWLEAA